MLMNMKLDAAAAADDSSYAGSAEKHQFEELMHNEKFLRSKGGGGQAQRGKDKLNRSPEKKNASFAQKMRTGAAAREKAVLPKPGAVEAEAAANDC